MVSLHSVNEPNLFEMAALGQRDFLKLLSLVPKFTVEIQRPILA